MGVFNLEFFKWSLPLTHVTVVIKNNVKLHKTHFMAQAGEDVTRNHKRIYEV